MKLIAPLAALCLALSAQAAFAPEGKFTYEHEILDFHYATAEECAADSGHWNAEEETCAFAVADEVEVRREGEGFLVSVLTVGRHYSECSFEGAGRLEGDVLVAEAAGEYFDDDGNLQQATCRLGLRYAADGSSLSVGVEGDRAGCANFCGFRAGLDIEEARRTL